MASSAPAASVGLTLAALAAATAYGSGPVLVLTAIPMLVIANAYRRCNLWNANCGASFEWVGPAINPYLGFLTGWLMITGYFIGAVATSRGHRPRRPGRVHHQQRGHLGGHLDRHRRLGGSRC
jgi:amino acid transporter